MANKPKHNIGQRLRILPGRLIGLDMSRTTSGRSKKLNQFSAFANVIRSGDTIEILDIDKYLYTVYCKEQDVSYEFSAMYVDNEEYMEKINSIDAAKIWREALNG